MSEEAADGRQVVLVAEDDAVTRMAAVAMLREAGFATAEATSGPLAILALEQTPGVRVLLTDIDMPLGFDGITLAACVYRRWPGIGIVMVSGKVAPVPGDVPDGAVFLAKPYAEETVLDAIGRMIERQDHLQSRANRAALLAKSRTGRSTGTIR